MKVNFLNGIEPVLVSMYGENNFGGWFDEVTGFMDKTQTAVNKGSGVFSSISDIFSPKQNPPPQKPAGFDYNSLIVPGAIIGGVLLIMMLKKKGNK
jgi:hypothetical protein